VIDATITLVGNLVDNPALRVTANGTSVCGFRIASTPRRFDRATNRWVDGATLFLRVSCWRQLAENVTASLSRGDRALVVGRLRQHTYSTQEGQRRVVYEIDAEAVAAELARHPVRVQRPARSAARSGVSDDPLTQVPDGPPDGSADPAGPGLEPTAPGGPDAARHGVDGHAVDGHGFDGHGFDGQGFDGHGVDDGQGVVVDDTVLPPDLGMATISGMPDSGAPLDSGMMPDPPIAADFGMMPDEAGFDDRQGIPVGAVGAAGTAHPAEPHPTDPQPAD